ncbi:MAG: AAA family ATPase [Planctomycetota bacterium]|nr:AAA family ATPase [Planctomycetota bacterium]
MIYDERIRNPNEETAFRWQNDKETLGGSSSRQPPPWKVGDQLGDFVLEVLLGLGSSGFVFRARDLQTSRRCALKLLRGQQADDLLRNKLGFRRMMTFDHPNLVRVDRIHQLGAYVALSMEEVDGQTLQVVREELTELPRDEAYQRLLKLIRDYSAGLAAMHTGGWVHRDIKPENLMLDQLGCGRVIDYGLVEAYEMEHATIETRGFILGTPHYIAPEVIWSQKYLPAGDIFSLGIVLLDTLRMLERQSVSKNVDLQRSEESTLHDANRIVEAIEDLPDSVPEILRETCREMLAGHPSERPTAMRLARLGLPPTQQIPWSVGSRALGREAETQQALAWVSKVFSGETGRLHVTGDSGIGKSRFIEEIVRYIESKNWGQVFVARCQVREDQPLQAFDQLCDGIAHRYLRGDRERIQMDLVSVNTLQDVFPVLKNVLEPTMCLPPAGQVNQSWDVLEAAARLSEQLRRVGPVFFVVDDSQWADLDSLRLLDHLQSSACDVGIGIITLSRNRQDPHRVPASCYLHLNPLTESDSIEFLENAAERWGVSLSHVMLRRLTHLTGGSLYRLEELAEEFRPDGALHTMAVGEMSEMADLSSLHRLWQQRAERLSQEAKRILLLIATAGGKVSIDQLGELTKLGDAVDAAVTELVRQRLVVDEATGGECISVYHDRVAGELIKTLSQQEKREAHLIWATLLICQEQAEQISARIAGHLFEASEPGRAVVYAIQAAEDADRRGAKAEAGRWYGRVTEHVTGDEKICQLRNAARCFLDADQPMQAADYYYELSQFVDGIEQVECLLMATSASMRCGLIQQFRLYLRELVCLVTPTSHRPRKEEKNHGASTL